MTMEEKIYLNPPQLSAHNIDEKIVCNRAHRERIFNVSAQWLDDKLIIHNYGQGGAGFTFLFGCVADAITLLEQELLKRPFLTRSPITIVGAGCYGLLTAVMLASRGHHVKIVAAELRDVSSYKAAGFFFPRPRKTSTPQEINVFNQCGLSAYKQYLMIAHQRHPLFAKGAKVVPAYYDPAIDPGFHPYIEQGLVQKPSAVIIDFGNGKQYNAMEYQTLFIDVCALMDELWGHVHALGIAYKQQIITTFNDLEDAIIFNCTGLGAQKLVDDPRLISVQGHLITLKNQTNPAALHYMLNIYCMQQTARGYWRNELLYFAPKNEGILGITFLRAKEHASTNDHEFDRLLERAHNFFGT